jgi:hypothetical protein
MADASIHIHIDTPVSMDQVDKLLTAAIEAKGTLIDKVVPPGYRCVACYRDDGGHESGCQVAIQALSKEVLGR